MRLVFLRFDAEWFGFEQRIVKREIYGGFTPSE